MKLIIFLVFLEVFALTFLFTPNLSVLAGHTLILADGSMEGEFTAWNSSCTKTIGAGYSNLWAGLEVGACHLLVFSHFSAV